MNSRTRKRLLDRLHVVRTYIVHDYNVARMQSRYELICYIISKTSTCGAARVCHGNVTAVCPNRRQNRGSVRRIERRMIYYAGFPDAAPINSAQVSIYAAFVQKYHMIQVVFMCKSLPLSAFFSDIEDGHARLRTVIFS